MAKALAHRVRTGGTNGQEAPTDLSSRQEYSEEAIAQQKTQLAFLEQLEESNPQLRNILGGIQERIEGRRLWQREKEHRSHAFDDNVLHTVAFGGAPIAGVDIAECQAGRPVGTDDRDGGHGVIMRVVARMRTVRGARGVSRPTAG